MDIPTGLIDALKQKELVIFAGAGINDGLGLPSWGEFVKKTLKYLYDNKNDRQSKNYYKNLIDQFKNEQLSEIEALDKIKSDDSTITKQYVANVFGIASNISCPTHKRLLSVSKRIITTNFDNAFERAYESTHNGRLAHVIVGTRKEDDYTVDDFTNRLKNNKSFIFKIHGSREQPDSCIITSEAYKKFYTTSGNKARSILEQICRDYTLLFVGWSFHDAYFKDFINTHHGNRKYYIITNQDGAKELKDYSKFLESVVVPDYKPDTMNLLYDQLEKYVKKSVQEKLRSSIIFSNLTNDSLKKLAKSEVKKLKKDEALGSQGDDPDRFFVILEGEVTVKDADGVFVIKKAENEIVGEMSCILGEERTNNIYCSSKRGKVLIITRDMINELPDDEQEKLWKNISHSYFLRRIKEIPARESWNNIAKSIITSIKGCTLLEDAELNKYLLYYISELFG